MPRAVEDDGPVVPGDGNDGLLLERVTPTRDNATDRMPTARHRLLRKYLKWRRRLRETVLRRVPYCVLRMTMRVVTAFGWSRRLLFGKREHVLSRVLPRGPQHRMLVREALLNYAASAWLERAVRDPQLYRRWLRVSNPDVLQRLVGRGAVVVTVHSEFTWAPFKVLEQIDPHHLTVSASGRTDDDPPPPASSSSRRPARRIKQLLRIRRSLNAGGLVLIAGDGHQGRGTVPRNVLGRTFLFRPGAAVLAAKTDSLLVPLFLRLAPDGVLWAEFMPPLESTASALQERVDDLAQRCADLLAERINTLPQTMDCRWLDRLRRYPAAE